MMLPSTDPRLEFRSIKAALEHYRTDSSRMAVEALTRAAVGRRIVRATLADHAMVLVLDDGAALVARLNASGEFSIDLGRESGLEPTQSAPDIQLVWTSGASKLWSRASIAAGLCGQTIRLISGAKSSVMVYVDRYSVDCMPRRVSDPDDLIIYCYEDHD